MTVYFLMIGIPAVLAISNSIFKQYKFADKDKSIVDAFFIIWLIILIFRNEKIGVDLPVYKYHFMDFSSIQWRRLIEGIIRGEYEASFSVISRFVSNFTHEFQWVLVCCALISVVPIWILYRNNAKHGYLMVVLFVNIAPFVMYFSGLRQVIAMAFVVPCYKYCKEKKIIKFLLTVWLAYLAHNSAFILVLMYPIYHLRIKREIHLLYMMPMILVIRQYSFPLFEVLLQFMGDKYFDRYGEGIKETGAYSVLLLLTVLLIYSYFLVDSSKIDDETIGLRNILMLCVIIQIFAGVHTLAMRMNYYFLVFVPMLIPRIVDRGKKKNRLLMQVSLVSMVCFFTFYYFYEAYTGGDALEIYPYISMFSK